METDPLTNANRIGFDADIVIWYPEEEPLAAQSEADGPASISQGGSKERRRITITNSMLHHRIDYTPFEGIQVRNWPRWVYLRGKLAWDRDGAGVVAAQGDGEFVRRTRSTLLTGQLGRGPTGMMRDELSYWT